jgi:murein DD-endopeptidase MepM/ murein hydrolase activator NlpD
LFTGISWGITVILVAAMIGFLVWHPWTETGKTVAADGSQAGNSTQPAAPKSVGAAALPAFDSAPIIDAIFRLPDTHTIALELPRQASVNYTVDNGDSIFGIAKQFKLKPETILWANADKLNDNPDMISPGLALLIPPADGIYYQWKDGDTIGAVASRYKVKPDAILTWPGNKLDFADPRIVAGTYIMVPGGWREFHQWLVPTIPRGPAGVLKTILGPGACDTKEGGLGGSGTFIWPSYNHFISGNDYWSGHLGLDIGAGMGLPIFASDSGVVVYAGFSYGGYGNMVMIDHGNGFQTLYAHLSVVGITCGQNVAQGTVIGNAGATGNSTGAHLHFEVRFMGGFINPWKVLPAP